MPNKKSSTLRKNIIIRWRVKKDLCLRCGKDKNNPECINETCVEDYTKSDNRVKNEEKNEINLEKKLITIKNYRKQKDLCLRCGKDKNNPECINNECIENYDKSDNRSEEEINKDPRTVETPKYKLDKRVDLLKSEDECKIKLQKTETINYNRNFILISLKTGDNIIDFVNLRYLARKYNDSIIVIIGDTSKIYPYNDHIKCEKIPNILQLKNTSVQNIVNHLYSCSMFISYQSEFCKYCALNSIKCILLKEDDVIRNVFVRI